MSFAKIREPLEVPNLLELQRQSFSWLLGDEEWRNHLAEALDEGATTCRKPRTGGHLQRDGSILDARETMSLSFRDHRFEDPKYTEEQCREKDLTYAAPLFVTAEFMNPAHDRPRDVHHQRHRARSW